MTKRKNKYESGAAAAKGPPEAVDQLDRPEPSRRPTASKPSAPGRAQKLLPGLYLVATPIGNARDITLRALDVLAAANVIACEDTRVTAKLLAIHNISRPLIAYHEHNAEKAQPGIIRRLEKGQIVALVSDAGTPLVSDPGYRLIRACIEREIYLTHLPGPSSTLTGLLLSGLPADRFLFAGFPPVKGGKRRTFLTEIKSAAATLVLLESPKRLAASLADMAAVLGPREAAIGRELTKLFEEVRRGPLDQLASHYAAAGPPKGEVTVVIGPPPKDRRVDPELLDRLIVAALRDSSVRDATARVRAETGLPRRDIYARVLELADK